jgi:hypothetical protein
MSRRRLQRGEDGAALELALIFMVTVSLMVTGLLTFASTSSTATVVTRTTRGTDYDADAAMQADIATIRATAGQGVYGSSCASFTPAFTLNNPSRALRVDCFPVNGPSSQRRVVLSACLVSVSPSPPCLDSQAILRADVTIYDDGSFGRAVSIQSWSNQ